MKMFKLTTLCMLTMGIGQITFAEQQRATLPQLDSKTITTQCDAQIATVKVKLAAFAKMPLQNNALARWDQIFAEFEDFIGPVGLYSNVDPDAQVRQAADDCEVKINKYQTLLDSVQGRGPSAVLLPLVSVPELEAWILIWSHFEGIHAKSYTHIIRNILPDPTVVFDDIVVNEEILKRAADLSKYYDDLYHAIIEYSANGETVGATLRDLKKKLYLCLMAINILEGVRFYVSFA